MFLVLNLLDDLQFPSVFTCHPFCYIFSSLHPHLQVYLLVPLEVGMKKEYLEKAWAWA